MWSRSKRPGSIWWSRQRGGGVGSPAEWGTTDKGDHAGRAISGWEKLGTLQTLPSLSNRASWEGWKGKDARPHSGSLGGHGEDLLLWEWNGGAVYREVCALSCSTLTSAAIFWANFAERYKTGWGGELVAGSEDVLTFLTFGACSSSKSVFIFISDGQEIQCFCSRSVNTRRHICSAACCSNLWMAQVNQQVRYLR
ncbi:hypothetical protein ACOMHN_027007 [Nucella lapillus]